MTVQTIVLTNVQKCCGQFVLLVSFLQCKPFKGRLTNTHPFARTPRRVLVGVVMFFILR